MHIKRAIFPKMAFLKRKIIIMELSILDGLRLNDIYMSEKRTRIYERNPNIRTIWRRKSFEIQVKTPVDLYSQMKEQVAQSIERERDYTRYKIFY